MEEPLVLSEAELIALNGLMDGAPPTGSPERAFASFIQRGLASIEGEDVVFAESMQETFEALATCQTNVLVMDSAGAPVEQYYLGEETATARVLLTPDGLAFQKMERAELVEAIGAGMAEYLETAQKAPLPDDGSWAGVGEALGMEGLQPMGWGGLLITRGVQNPDEDDTRAGEWILVVRIEQGYVWQDTEHGILALAGNREELVELIAGLVA